MNAASFEKFWPGARRDERAYPQRSANQEQHCSRPKRVKRRCFSFVRWLQKTNRKGKQLCPDQLEYSTASATISTIKSSPGSNSIPSTKFSIGSPLRLPTVSTSGLILPRSAAFNSTLRSMARMTISVWPGALNSLRKSCN